MPLGKLMLIRGSFHVRIIVRKPQIMMDHLPCPLIGLCTHLAGLTSILQHRSDTHSNPVALGIENNPRHALIRHLNQSYSFTFKKYSDGESPITIMVGLSRSSMFHFFWWMYFIFIKGGQKVIIKLLTKATTRGHKEWKCKKIVGLVSKESFCDLCTLSIWAHPVAIPTKMLKGSLLGFVSHWKFAKTTRKDNWIVWKIVHDFIPKIE